MKLFGTYGDRTPDMPAIDNAQTNKAAMPK